MSNTMPNPRDFRRFMVVAPTPALELLGEGFRLEDFIAVAAERRRYE